MSVIEPLSGSVENHFASSNSNLGPLTKHHSTGLKDSSSTSICRSDPSRRYAVPEMVCLDWDVHRAQKTIQGREFSSTVKIVSCARSTAEPLFSREVTANCNALYFKQLKVMARPRISSGLALRVLYRRLGLMAIGFQSVVDMVLRYWSGVLTAAWRTC